jgi:REP element-mobilizing transposase RayT
MARPLRLQFPGAVYHVTARGNARQCIFLDDHDRHRFIDLLAKEIEQQQWLCYAWCLMDNHYHLLFETPEANLVAGMRRLNQVYTQSFNRRHDRVGHLLQGRYKSIVVEKQSHLLELTRYVVLNPVRAGATQTAAQWPWSSYRATAGMAPAPSWLQVAWVLSNFGGDEAVARAAYREFVADGVESDSPWQSLRGQIWLGSEQFRERMARQVAGLDLAAIPEAQRRPDRPSVAEVLAEVADAFGLAPAHVLDRSQQSAFKAGVYLLRRVCNLSLGEAARLAGVSPSRVSRIQAELERGEAPEGLDEGLADTLARLLARYKVKH